MNNKISAKIAMDEELKIKYAAFVLGKRIPCGYHKTKKGAIAAGKEWITEAYNTFSK